MNGLLLSGGAGKRGHGSIDVLKDTRTLVGDFIVNLSDFGGLSFGDRMALSQLKIKRLNNNSFTEEELDCGISILSKLGSEKSYNS